MKNQVDRTQFIITNRVRCSTKYPGAPSVYSTPMAYARRCVATVHNQRLKHTSSLPKYHFTVQSSPVKDGHVDPRREGNFGGPLRRERGRSRHARANKVHERGCNLRP